MKTSLLQMLLTEALNTPNPNDIIHKRNQEVAYFKKLPSSLQNDFISVYDMCLDIIVASQIIQQKLELSSDAVELLAKLPVTLRITKQELTPLIGLKQSKNEINEEDADIIQKRISDLAFIVIAIAKVATRDNKFSFIRAGNYYTIEKGNNYGVEIYNVTKNDAVYNEANNFIKNRGKYFDFTYNNGTYSITIK